MKKLAILFLALFFFSLKVYSRECEELKKVFLSENKPNEQDIFEFKSGVENGNQCLRNLMGILLYEGKAFPKDELEAKKIFYALSNNNYPESQFNLAWVLSKDDDQDPQLIINMFLGIHAKYIGDSKNYHLSSKAKDLGRQYINNLSGRVHDCKIDKCKSFLRNVTSELIINLSKNYEDGISNATIDAGSRIKQALQEQKATEDMIFTILLIGAATYSISNSAALNNAPSSPAQTWQPWMHPNYNWHFPQFCC